MLMRGVGTVVGCSMVKMSSRNHVLQLISSFSSRAAHKGKAVSRASGRGERLARETKAKVLKRRGEFLFGIAPCLAALQAHRRRVHAIFLKQGGMTDKRRELKKMAVTEVEKYARQHKVDVHYIDRDTMDRMSEKRPHQGMVLDVNPLRFKTLSPAECRATTKKSKTSERPPVWLALDEIHDPMNFGAILRCALFLGVDKVVATEDKFCHLSPVVSKASSGAMELMHVYSVGSMTKFLKDAGANGWHVLGTCSADPAGSDKVQGIPLVDCHHHVLQGPTILVLGNEGAGVRSGVERCCSTMLTIAPTRQLPMGFDSLNVAVATGILLHHLQKP